MSFYTLTWIRLSTLLLGPLLTTFLANCSTVVKAGLHLIYEPATLNREQIHRDLPYWSGDDFHDEKHLLDLFVPKGPKGWPILIFVHGGGWMNGDKDLRIGEDDIYSNIGRFFASRGIGVAVINYRLLPEVTWTDQVRDVARAIAWTYRNIAGYGGDPDRLFLSGHSAGAWLIAHTTLNTAYLNALELPNSIIKGVIGISGVGYDMVEEKSYEMGVDIDYLIPRFRLAEDDPDYTPDWQRQASPLFLARADAPPFLLIYGEREWDWLRHQNEIFAKALRTQGALVDVRIIENEGHRRMALSLSHPQKPPSRLMEDFVFRRLLTKEPENLEPVTEKTSPTAAR